MTRRAGIHGLLVTVIMRSAVSLKASEKSLLRLYLLDSNNLSSHKGYFLLQNPLILLLENQSLNDMNIHSHKNHSFQNEPTTNALHL